MMDFFSEEMRRDPYSVYDRMRSGSPVLHIPEPDLWMIFDNEGVKRAPEAHDAFSSRASPPGSTGEPLPWLVFLDPRRHEGG
jgi:cytochrome P450